MFLGLNAVVPPSPAHFSLVMDYTNAYAEPFHSLLPLHNVQHQFDYLCSYLQ